MRRQKKPIFHEKHDSVTRCTMPPEKHDPAARCMIPLPEKHDPYGLSCTMPPAGLTLFVSQCLGSRTRTPPNQCRSLPSTSGSCVNGGCFPLAFVSRLAKKHKVQPNENISAFSV